MDFIIILYKPRIIPLFSLLRRAHISERIFNPDPNLDPDQPWVEGGKGEGG
jgi:hypothetical protein